MRGPLTVLALWAAGLGAAAQFAKISFLYDEMTQSYPDHAGVGIGLMVSVVGMVGLVFGLMAGLWVGRIGPRRAVLTALTLGAALSAIQSTLPGYGVMMATRVLEGSSHLAIVVVGPTAIASIASPRFQGMAMILWSSFFGVAFAAMAVLVPALIAGHGTASLFVVHSLWMLTCAMALWLLMPADPVGKPQIGQGGLWAQHVATYASPEIAAPATGFVCYTVVFVALLTLLPAQMSPGWGKLAGVGMPLASILVSLTLGVWLLSRVPAFRLVQYGFGASMVSVAALWVNWGHGASELAAALAVAASLGIVQGASFAAIPQLNSDPAERARAAGAIAQLGNLGTTGGTPLLALILPVAGPDGLAIFVAAFAGVGIGMHAWHAQRRG